MKNFLFLVLGLFILGTASAQEANTYFKPLKYRCIGPFRGGRSVAVSGVITDPLTYYMGTSGGGLWKTQDAGQRWTNISDGFFKTSSVGAVAVSESNSNVIYVGMGESAVRNFMTSYGDGVYKSTDAGRTWEKLGLDKTRHISRIVINPNNPDIVFVAAQGAEYGPSKERGVYKSVDGGKTWKKVLFVNDSTGSADLSMDKNDPEVLYTAMWHIQRTPWKIISGGNGSDLYKSTDSGDTWFRIYKGLPKEKGKMAIAVCPSNSEKVYALIESNNDNGGLFVSNNSGKNWHKVSGDKRLTQRAWYYTKVFVDPNNENTVYVLTASALRSIDGGKTWEVLIGNLSNNVKGTHDDFHDLWINPKNSKNMIIANDGGAAISFNNGKTWSTQANMPTGQFYRVNADNLFPYNLYGGQQDWGSVKIASLSLGRRVITRRDWTWSAGHESAFLAFNPDNPRYVMGGSFLGTIDVLDTKSKTSTKIMEAPIDYHGRAARNMKYLFEWSAPTIRSQHEPGTYYHCAQFVFRTKDMGRTWGKISPDLTRNLNDRQGNGGGPYTNEALGDDNYGVISYMKESPSQKGEFWTGSNDGLVYLTRDDGVHWNNVTPKGLKQCLINAIEVSPHNPATAYIATTRYKFNDFTPAIYKTTNYGKSWTNISSGIPYGAFTRVVREDPIRKNLLYAGTELGMYISWNGGKTWQSFQLNLPITTITDLMVHDGNLLVATAGRAFWILDDLTVLEQYHPHHKEKIKIYKPAPAIYGSWGSPLNVNSDKFKGTYPLAGVNPTDGVVFYYELPKMTDSIAVTLQIRNDKGTLIRSFSSIKDTAYKKWDGGPPPTPTMSKKEGLNRLVWDMRYPIMPGIPNVYYNGSFKGHMASPGTYEAQLKVGNNILTTNVLIKKNPLYGIKETQYKTYDAFMRGLEQPLTGMYHKISLLKKAQGQIKKIILILKKKKGHEVLIKAGNTLIAQLMAWDEAMVQRKRKAYDDVEGFPGKFTSQYKFLINQTESSIPNINKSSIDRKAVLDLRWEKLNARANKLINSAIPEFNKQLWEAGIGAIKME